MPLIVAAVRALLRYETTVTKAVQFFGSGCAAVLFGVVAYWFVNPVVSPVEAVGANGFLVIYAFFATLVTAVIVAVLSLSARTPAGRGERVAVASMTGQHSPRYVHLHPKHLDPRRNR